MTTYNTGNPIGSTHPLDLNDNAGNMDVALNSRTSKTFTDRLGEQRKTWFSVETDLQEIIIAGGRIFPDEPAGRAAVDDGEYFYSESEDPDIAKVIWQRVDSASSRMVAVEPTVQYVDRAVEQTLPAVEDFNERSNAYSTLDGEDDDYAYVITDREGRVALGIHKDGKVTHVRANEEPNAVAGNVVWAMVDESGQMAFGINSDGRVVIQRSNEYKADFTDFEWGISDHNGKISLGVKKNGEVFANIPGLTIKPKVKVAIVGDSITQTSFGRPEAWPVILQRFLDMTDGQFEVHNFAVGGASFDNALNGATLYKGTSSIVDAAIAWQPDVVIIALGFNDIFSFGHDAATTILDADALIAALKDGLPITTKFELMRQYTWDRDAGTPVFGQAGPMNKNTIANFHLQLDQVIDTVTYKKRSNTAEYLDTTLWQQRTDRQSYLNDLNEHLLSVAASDPQVNSEAIMDLYRVNRMGWHVDGLHPSAMAHLFFAGAIAKVLRDSSFYEGEFDNLSSIRDPDAIFDPDTYWATNVAVAAGAAGWNRDYYLVASEGQDIWLHYHGVGVAGKFANWMFTDHRDLSWALQKYAYDDDSPVTLMLSGIPGETTDVRILDGGNDTWVPGTVPYDSGSAANASGNVVTSYIPNKLFYGSVVGPGNYDVGLMIFNEGMGTVQVYEFVESLTIAN